MDYKTGYTRTFRQIYKQVFSRGERTSGFLLKRLGTSVVGFENQEPALCVYLLENKDMVYILYLGVLPEYRLQGLGRQTLAWLARSGKAVVCGIGKDGPESFYKGCGFSDTGWVHTDGDGSTRIFCLGDFDPVSYRNLWNETFKFDYPLELRQER